MSQAILVRIGDVDVLLETTIVTVAGSQPTAAPDRAADKLSATFERAQQAIAEIGFATARTVARLAERSVTPDEVHVRFGLSVSATGDIVVTSVTGTATLNIELAYRTDPHS